LLCECLDRSVFEEKAIDIKWRERERKAIEKKRNE
jgi:hypothetical protein